MNKCVCSSGIGSNILQRNSNSTSVFPVKAPPALFALFLSEFALTVERVYHHGFPWEAKYSAPLVPFPGKERAVRPDSWSNLPTGPGAAIVENSRQEHSHQQPIATQAGPRGSTPGKTRQNNQIQHNVN
jgi:hypothetical protein